MGARVVIASTDWDDALTETRTVVASRVTTGLGVELTLDAPLRTRIVGGRGALSYIGFVAYVRISLYRLLLPMLRAARGPERGETFV